MAEKPSSFSLAETIPPPPLERPHWLESQLAILSSPFTREDGITVSAEMSTGVEDECRHQEDHLETETAQISAITDIGGPLSKYSYETRTNEDLYLICVDHERLLVLAGDGAGGSGRGRLAARVLATSFRNHFKENNLSPKELAEAVDRDVSAYAKEDPENPLDTTIGIACGAAFLSDKEKYGEKGYLIAAGDSQAFVIRQGKLVPDASTYPQNYPGEFVRKGFISNRRDFLNADYHNNLTNAFGPLPYRKEPHQIIEFAYQPGDTVILASDGIFNAVSEFEIARICEEEQGDPKRIQKRVYDLAYERQNSLKEFDMQISEDPSDLITRSVHILTDTDVNNPASLPDHQKGGDNLVLAVVTLK